MKQQFAKCLLQVYFELIRSDIPGPSDVNPSRPPALRPSLPSIMKPSREGPSALKPTQEKLQARVESLVKKKRSVKHKAQAPPERSGASFHGRGAQGGGSKKIHLGGPPSLL